MINFLQFVTSVMGGGIFGRTYVMDLRATGGVFLNGSHLHNILYICWIVMYFSVSLAGMYHTTLSTTLYAIQINKEFHLTIVYFLN